jgi:hypothetical protein
VEGADVVEEEEGGRSDEGGEASAEAATRDHFHNESVAGPGGHREKRQVTGSQVSCRTARDEGIDKAALLDGHGGCDASLGFYLTF